MKRKICEKRCVTCKHARINPDEKDKEYRLYCQLARKGFFKAKTDAQATVWVINMDPKELNVCSLWEQLTPKIRTASRILGLNIPTKDPLEGTYEEDKRVPLWYPYIRADGRILSATKEELEAQMCIDKNLHTVHNRRS